MFKKNRDQQLFSRIKHGDHGAFTKIVKLHTDNVFKLAYKTLGNTADAEDITQQIFIRLWQQPHQWNPKKSKFSTWLYQVTLNKCIDHLRRSKKNEQQADSENNFPITSLNPTLLAITDNETQHEQQKLLQIGLQQLTENQRKAIHLVSFCELPQKTVADMMGINIKALESLMSRAKNRLKQVIQQHTEDTNEQF